MVVGRRTFLKAAAASGLGLLVAGCEDGRGAGDADVGPDGTGGTDGPDGNNGDVRDSEDREVGPDGRFDPRAFAASSETFPYAVQAGDTGVTRAVLWTRYVGAGPVTLVVMPADADLEATALPIVAVAVAVADGGFVHAPVHALLPDRGYRYVFVAPDAAGHLVRSAIGRFRTAPGVGFGRVVRFGASACSNLYYRPYRTLTHAAAADLDFHVLLGDTCYCDGAVTRDEYRAKWETSFTDPGYQALFPSCTVYATWDDHEVANDWVPDSIDPTWRKTAEEAFAEHLAFARGGPNADAFRLWRSFRWGDTLELFVLDCRGERRLATQHTPAAQCISRAQMDWLKAGLTASTAHFKVIASSFPVADMPGVLQGNVRDRWANYETQRSEILGHIAGRTGTAPIPGVFWVTGDYHMAALTHLDPPGGPDAGRLEIMSSPAGNGPNALWQQALDENPAQFVWGLGAHNVVVLEADPDADSLRATWLGDDGEVLHTADVPRV